MKKQNNLLKDSLKIVKDDCRDHDHAPDGECLVIELEPLCGKPKNHNGGNDSKKVCNECLAIAENI